LKASLGAKRGNSPLTKRDVATGKSQKPKANLSTTKIHAKIFEAIDANTVAESSTTRSPNIKSFSDNPAIALLFCFGVRFTSG